MKSDDKEENENLDTVMTKKEYFSHVDECHALIDQVSLASAKTLTKLTCFDVGKNYMVFGTNVGTLFVFNRRLNRTATPLETIVHDTITCVKLLSGENDFLAAGHSFGTLALLNFPTGEPGSTRKLEKSLLFDKHRRKAITCISWTEDGRKVFSADNSGNVVVTAVNFEHNIFETTTVCSQLSYVTQLIHFSSFLAISTAQKVTVINESWDPLLEIEEQQHRVIGINLLNKSCGSKLLVLLSNGSLMIYDIFRGEKTGHFSLMENIVKTFPESNIQIERRSEKWGSNILVIHKQKFLVNYRSFIVLLNFFEDQVTILSVFDAKNHFDIKECEDCSICVDPIVSCPTIYFLCPNRVFRLSSDEAPVYLKQVLRPQREYSTKNFFSSIQKNTSLLPNASKDILFEGMKVAKELNVLSSLRNIPIPILTTVVDYNSFLRKSRCGISLCGESSGSSFGTDEVGAVMSVGKNMSKTLEQMQISRENIIENVNKIARKVVDTVGGYGTQAKDGFLIESVCDLEKEISLEQNGILHEIAVRRTKTTTAATKQRKINETLKNCGQNALNLTSEDFIAIDESALEHIKEGESVSSQMLAVPSQSCHANSTQKKQGSCVNVDFEQIPDQCEENHQVALVEEIIDVCNAKDNEGNNLESEQVLVKETEDSLISDQLKEENAYEFLMKNAIRRKSLTFEVNTSETMLYPLDNGQLVKQLTVVNNFGDMWSEIRLPYSCTFSVSSNYLIICDLKKKKKPCYLSIPFSSKPQWIKFKQKADHFVVNDNGTLVWKILKNLAYTPSTNIFVPDFFLKAVSWMVVASEGGGIVEVALTKDSAWYITKSGEVYVQLRLPEMGILSRCETPWPLHSITASEFAVWALHAVSGHLVVRAGLKHSPVGLDWIEAMPLGPKRLISICLYDHSGWAIDENCSLWFTNGVGFQNPFGSTGNWMRVYNPWDVSPDINRLRTLPWVIRVSSAGVFVCVDHKCYMSSSSGLLSGHCLEHIVPDKLAVNDNFELIAGGDIHNIDCLVLCRLNEIFLYRLQNTYFYSFPAFPASFTSDIIEISSFDGKVYILDSTGCIYVKENITSLSPFGTDWKLLDTGPCGSPVVSFAITSVSIWVLTVLGEVCLYIKSAINDPLVGSGPIWIHIKTSPGSAVNKIRASCNGLYVWIFSINEGRAWARSFITDVVPAGRSWLEANNEPGVKDVAVGCKVIWSISASGLLHRLQGLAAGNPAGNYWKPVPLYLSAITLDRKERLWGIDLNGRLVSHKLCFISCLTFVFRAKFFNLPY
ncbi:unnamed protein product [Thelazia callipaeda]|uniref:Tectonin beta-propeller repeat-containing protein 2 n=1 Tax=Thelazia callipaeda TaxID=103827 RepID=A0A0N5CP97_THECL|nr:unnamed protein product [Thelazia callipaeda]